MESTDYQFLGKGIYTVTEAAKLIRVSQSRIRRWLRRYTYAYGKESRLSNPLVSADYQQLDKFLALSFLDLMEMRFVNSFLEYGISLRKIRIAVKRAQEIINQSHPFTSKKFHTDRRTILMEIATRENEQELLDLVKNQYAMKKVFAPYLFRGIVFDNNDRLYLWYPLVPKKSIVIDPSRNFGQPVLNTEGIPTATIAGSYNAEHSISAVSRWYNIKKSSVADALEFERTIAA